MLSLKHRLRLHILVLQNQKLAELVRVDIQRHRQAVLFDRRARLFVFTLDWLGDGHCLINLLIVVIN